MTALYNELREGILSKLNAEGLLKTDDEDYQNKANNMCTKAVSLLKDYLATSAVSRLKEDMGIRSPDRW